MVNIKLFIEEDYFKIFDDFFVKDEIVELFILLYEHDFSVNATAKHTYRHRNTIVYWLDKFKKVTGLDLLHDFESKVILYMYFVSKGYHKTCKFDLM